MPRSQVRKRSRSSRRLPGAKAVAADRSDIPTAVDPTRAHCSVSVDVQTQDFDLAQEIGVLTQGRTDIGAVVTFTGLVREMTKDGPITELSLEHYPGMTEAELQRIGDEAARRWPLSGLRIVHRVGSMAPGDQIVLVIACSPHRDAAFDGARFVMDFLKTDAPFWKKETAQHGAPSWVDARDTDQSARDRWQS